MRGGLVHVIVNLQSKKADWIRLAYLLDNLGPQSIDTLTFSYSQVFPERSRSRGSIAAVILGYRKKGFSRMYVNRIPFYGFYGDLPNITQSTRYRWNLRLSPLKGGIEFDDFKSLNEENIWDHIR